MNTGLPLGPFCFNCSFIHSVSSGATWPRAMRIIGPVGKPRNKKPLCSKRKRSYPKIRRKSIHALSLQFWSWLPSTIYQGLRSFESSSCAIWSDSPSPPSAMSPVTSTKSMLSVALICCTDRRKSCRGLGWLLLICTSVTTAKRKGSKAFAGKVKAISKMAISDVIKLSGRNFFILGFFCLVYFYNLCFLISVIRASNLFFS